MKKILIILILFLLFNPHMALGSVTTIVIDNPGFENPVTSWSAVQCASIVQDSENERSGDFAGYWRTNIAISADHYIITDMISGVFPDQSGTFTIYSKDEDNRPISAFINWYTEDEVFISQEIGTPSSNSGSYVQLVVTDISPSNAAKVRFGLINYDRDDKCYADDAAFSGSAFVSEFNLLSPLIALFSLFLVISITIKKQKKLRA